MKKQMELRELAESVMDVVTTVAGRRLAQVMEAIYEEEIGPLRRRVKELEAELAALKDRD